MESLLEIIRHTPYWVWGVLVYLFYAGLKARQTRRQSPLRMLIIPGVFLCWGLVTIIHSPVSSGIVAVSFVLTLILGGVIGWQIGKNAGVYLPEERCFMRNGSSWPLVLMLATFCGRFYFSMQQARFPELAHNTFFSVLSGAFSGIAAGIFWGISFRLLSQIRRGNISRSSSR
ncbi:DUF6622 family protein [Pectobacterium sp. B1J-3]|uniref:DUF6622 family protein n=1 Tax=Pectobacterium sp. B1J-3 TaxID=3385371 RepID=UPI0039067094